MNHMQRTIGIFTVLAMLSSVAPGATYYVDPVNGSPSGDGSQGNPWQTLQEVMANKICTKDVNGVVKNAAGPVVGGDTVLLLSGYHGDINYTQGYNDDYITIAAADGQEPVLRRLRISGGSKWIFRGLTITPSAVEPYDPTTLVDFNSRGSGICEDLVLEDSFLYSKLDSSTWTAQQWLDWAPSAVNLGDYGKRLVARNNHMLNIAFGVSAAAKDSITEYNVIENFRGDGVRVVDDGQLVQYNTIKNCYNVDDNHDDGIQGFESYLADGDGVSDVVIRGNLIINQTDPNQLHPGPLQGIGCFDGPFIDWIVENNVIMVDHWHGITLYRAAGCLIRNNTTFSSLYHDGITNRYNWISITPQSGGGVNIIRNNISQGHEFATGIKVVEDHNIIISPSEDATSYFVDYLNGDLRLVAGSPAIDAGSSDLATMIDFDQNYRPIGAGWDCGAFEFGATSHVPVIADAGPDQTIVDADGNGYEIITVDGSGSSALSGTITEYLWTQDGRRVSTDATGVTILEVGVYTLTLEVTASTGWKDTDEVVISIVPPSADKPGDANRDGVVDLNDFVILKTNFGRSDASWEDGDFNGDQSVDLGDFVILKTNFGT